MKLTFRLAQARLAECKARCRSAAKLERHTYRTAMVDDDFAKESKELIARLSEDSESLVNEMLSIQQAIDKFLTVSEMPVSALSVKAAKEEIKQLKAEKKRYEEFSAYYTACNGVGHGDAYMECSGVAAKRVQQITKRIDELTQEIGTFLDTAQIELPD